MDYEPAMRRRYLVLAAVAALLVMMGAELLLSIRQISRTADEQAHLYAGYQHWRAHDFGVNPEHPPLVKLVAAAPLLGLELRQPHPPNPVFFAEEYIGGGQLLGMNDGESLLLMSRTAVAVFSLLLALMVFTAGYEMFGPAAGLLGMALLVFEPTVLAHGALVTTDMGVAACLFFAVYAFYRYSVRPGWGRLLVFGLGVGLTLAAKMSGAIVLPIVAVCAGLDLLMHWDRRRAGQLLGAIVFGAVAGYVVLWAFYGFRYEARTGGLTIAPPLAAFAMGMPSHALARLVLTLARWHVLPEAYLYGWTKLPIDQMAHPLFLFGRVYPTGVWFYFPVALLIKSSLTLLLLVLASPLLWVRGLRVYRRELIFVVAPMVVILGASMTSKLDIGVRHVLPIYPFAALLAGATASVLARGSRVARYPVAALMLFQVVSSVHAFPNYIPYSNEMFGGTNRTYKVISDSNVDWNQELVQVNAYLQANHVRECWLAYSQASQAPVGYGVPCKLLPSGLGLWAGQPQGVLPPRISGLVLVGASEAAGGTWGDGDINPYRQFQEGRPKAVVAGSMLVYEGTYDVPLLAAEAHYSQVPMLLMQGRGDAALAEAREATEIAPDSAVLRADLGGTLLKLHREAEAEAEFAKAMEMAKEHRPDQTEAVAKAIGALRHPRY